VVACAARRAAQRILYLLGWDAISKPPPCMAPLLPRCRCSLLGTINPPGCIGHSSGHACPEQPHLVGGVVQQGPLPCSMADLAVLAWELGMLCILHGQLQLAVSHSPSQCMVLAWVPHGRPCCAVLEVCQQTHSILYMLVGMGNTTGCWLMYFYIFSSCRLTTATSGCFDTCV
jgi:hypothetical protein